jgi:hypothetical protein
MLASFHPRQTKSYAAFEQLSQELDVQLSSLHETLQTDLAAFNRSLSKDAQPVTVGQ